MTAKSFSPDRAIQELQRELDTLKRQLSGYGLAKTQTRNTITVGPPGSIADYICLGNSDDQTWNRAIYENPNATTLLALSGQYTLNKPVNGRSNLTIQGEGVGRTIVVIGTGMDDTVGAPSGGWYHCIGAIGDTYGSALTPNANISPGDNIIKFATGASISDIYEGDLLFLRSEGAWSNTAGTAGAVPAYKRGEYVKAAKLGVDVNITNAKITARNTTTLISRLTANSGTPFLGLVPSYTITLSNCNDTDNNGTWLISAVDPSGTYVDLYMPPSGCSSPDYGMAGIVGTPTILTTGPTLSVFGMIRDSYTTASSATLYRMNLVRGFGIKDLEIRQQPPNGTRGSDSYTPPPVLGFRKCRNFSLRNVYIHNVDAAAVVVESGYQGSIEGCQFGEIHDLNATNSYGHGIVIGNASEQITVSNTTAARCKHGFSTGQLKGAPGNMYGYGVPRGITVNNMIVSQSTAAAFYTQPECEGVTLTGCAARDGDNWGFLMEGTNCWILGSSVMYCAGGIAFGSTSTVGVWYEGSSSVQGGAFTGYGGVAKGNVIAHIKNVTSPAADLYGTGLGGSVGGIGMQLSRSDHCVISDNTVMFCDQAGIRIRKRSRGNLIQRNQILDCNMQNVSTDLGSGITADTARTGTATIIAVSGSSTVWAITATLSGSILPTNADVGSRITFASFTDTDNNGTFTLLTVVGNTVTFTNTNAGTPSISTAEDGDWEEESSDDNAIIDNFIANRPFMNAGASNAYERDTVGHIKYGLRNSSTTARRNLWSRNTCINMATGVFLNNSIKTTQWAASGNSSGDYVWANTVTEPYAIPTHYSGSPADGDFGRVPTPGTIILDEAASPPSLVIRGTDGVYRVEVLT